MKIKKIKKAIKVLRKIVNQLPRQSYGGLEKLGIEDILIGDGEKEYKLIKGDFAIVIRKN